MKKILTILLSVLMVATLGVVNVSADEINTNPVTVSFAGGYNPNQTTVAYGSDQNVFKLEESKYIITGGTAGQDYAIFYRVDTPNGEGTWNKLTDSQTITGKDAGTYTLKLKVLTKLTSAADYNSNDVVATLDDRTNSIAKANSSSTVPTLELNWTYDETSHYLVSSGSASGGELAYSSTETGTYSTTVPTATNAGTYDVWYKVQGDKNHNDTTAAKIGTVTVSKADGSVTAPTGKTGLTYNGTDQELVEGGSSTTGTVNYSINGGATWSTTIPTGKNADTYTVSYKSVGDANHNDSAVGTVSVTIGKASATVTANNQSKAYGESDPTLTATVTGTFGTDTLTYSVTRDSGETTGATYVITPSGDATQGNYNVTYASGLLTITKATPTLVSSKGTYYANLGGTVAAEVANAPDEAESLKIGTKTLANGTDYTATKNAAGNWVYTLTSEAKKTLTVGNEYTVTFNYNTTNYNANPEYTLTVKNYVADNSNSGNSDSDSSSSGSSTTTTAKKVVNTAAY